MSVLLRYFMVVVACACFVLGMQLPGLADQYAKRVDATLREVTVNFMPYQEIARHHAGGSIEQLIELHRRSDVQVFKAEGGAIENLYRRKQRFEAEHLALQTHLPGRLLHMALRGDRELLQETVAQYGATVPLNQEALMAGGLVALLILLAIEGVLALLRQLIRLTTRWFNHRWRGAD